MDEIDLKTIYVYISPNWNDLVVISSTLDIFLNERIDTSFEFIVIGNDKGFIAEYCKSIYVYSISTLHFEPDQNLLIMDNNSNTKIKFLLLYWNSQDQYPSKLVSQCNKLNIPVNVIIS